MNNLPEHEPLHPEDAGINTEAHVPEPQPAEVLPPEAWPSPSPSSSPVDAPGEPPFAELPLFSHWMQPEIPASVRIPHLGHLLLLFTLALFGLLGASVFIRTALYFHLFGVSTVQQAIADVHYTLGSEAALYLLTLGACLFFFPMVWHRSFFAGVHWNGAAALRMRRQLLTVALVCFLLALVSGYLLPGPTNTPIDKLFRRPGAAWMLFAFGVTFAPFFEETFFRGFLLPALCTACDWLAERTVGQPKVPLDENGHPIWSMRSMIIASLFTSIPFAWLHAAQTSYSAGPLFLLVCVSLVLCWARLSSRSLAASVLVHACYNFLLFSFMMLGTDGFRHLEKM